MKGSIFLGVVGIVGTLASAAVHAQFTGGEVKAFGSLSYQLTFDSDDRPNSEGHGVHVGAAYFFTPNLGVELASDLSTFGDDNNSGRDGRSANIKLGGLYSFQPGMRFEPYVGLGGGLANNKLDNPDDTRRRAFAEGTVGVLTYLNRNVGIRGEFAYRYTDGIPSSRPGFARNSANEALLRVGLVFPVLRTVPVSLAAAPVEQAGPPDEDGDGVPDSRDRCPGTPPGTRVNAHGCPIDSDGDGVPDAIDDCPDTAPGVQVDASGCPLLTTFDVKFEDVNFGLDKSNLTDFARASLDRTAAELRALIAEGSEVAVSVEGHTDSQGPASYNQKLGGERAAVVRDYLVRQGIGAAMISTSSAGETRPVATNETAKGRLLNRRVEIRASGKR